MRIIKKVLILAVILTPTFFFIQCQNGERSEQEALSASAKEGKKLAETFCISCHDPQAPMDARLAPPLAAVQQHYADFTEGEEAFKSQMIRFLTKPDTSYALMPNAVEKFGLMPKMALTAEQNQQLVDYIFEAKLKGPEWYQKHYKENHDAMNDPVAKGVQMAQATKAVLGSNLKKALKERGAAGAVDFCATRALPLTDSMALQQGVSIQRVSDRNRNPNNAADSISLLQIERYKEQLAAGEALKGTATVVGGEQWVFAPILTNGMCLQCHGEAGKEVEEATLKVIQEKYPDDQATGYSLNELRGIWKVSWKLEED